MITGSWDLVMINALAESNVLRSVRRGDIVIQTGMNKWVMARDRDHKLVLLGGLGAAGVGLMWVAEDASVVDVYGFDSAPEMQSPDQTQRPQQRELGSEIIGLLDSTEETFFKHHPDGL